MNDRRQAGSEVHRKLSHELTREEAILRALSDPLTMLPNRAAYAESFGTTAFDVAANSECFTAAIDLDSLSYWNGINHSIGDRLICAVADAIRGATDTGYRIGGDEFVVTADSLESLTHAMKAIRNELSKVVIKATDAEGFSVELRGVPVSVGIGRTYAKADERCMLVKVQREQAGKRAVKGAAPIGILRRAA